MNSVQQLPDPQTSRFPFPIPFGWFHIAMDDEIAVGEIKTIKAFGREMVLWRAESGGTAASKAVVYPRPMYL